MGSICKLKFSACFVFMISPTLGFFVLHAY